MTALGSFPKVGRPKKTVDNNKKPVRVTEVSES